MNDPLNRILNLFKSSSTAQEGPQKIFWSYSSYGVLLLAIILSGIGGYNFLTGIPPLIMAILFMVCTTLTLLAARLLVNFLLNILKFIPGYVYVIIGSGIISLWVIKSLNFSFPEAIFYQGGVLLLLLTILLFGFIGILINDFKSFKLLKVLGIIIPLAVIGLGAYWLWQDGKNPFLNDLASIENQTKKDNRVLQALDIKDPSSHGDFEIEMFTYGSGNDSQRTEYAEGVKYKTPSVDASKILIDWKGKKKKWRERYWDFGVENLPINGRVYLPNGEGPFPLVLIVHGNHSMIDYSDDGYGYLGELLASRGFITVSVDENFINGHWSGDFRGKEMTTRAWLLLKHLEIWKGWSTESNHDLFSKVDMNNIMLIGHSRGGEAVAIAAAFNKLTHLPDNALELFDFNFNIKSIVSIAPTDYRYTRRVKLKDINLLSLQGSYDADETSFWGMRQFERTEFSDDFNGYKSGIYVHKANHGQFKSTWGIKFFGAQYIWMLNTHPMLSGSDQRQVASVFISAFAEATLNNNNAWKPIFTNTDLASNWLPENYYLSQYSDNQEDLWYDFEEDIDVTTGTRGSKISTKNLKIWQEAELMSRDDQSRNNNYLLIGWDYGEEIKSDSIASVIFTLPHSEELVKLDSSKTLLLRLATGDPSLLKRDEKVYGKTKDINLSFLITLIDNEGRKASINSDVLKNLTPRLKVKYTKIESVDSNFGDDWEIHPEDFQFPFEKFDFETEFDFTSIRSVELKFDQTTYGVLAIDNVGFR